MIGASYALMLITAKGQTIKIKASDIRVISRVTQGVRLINLDEDDLLVSATTVEPDEDEQLQAKNGSGVITKEPTVINGQDAEKPESGQVKE